MAVQYPTMQASADGGSAPLPPKRWVDIPRPEATQAPPSLPQLGQTQNDQGAGAVTAMAVSNTGGWTVPSTNPSAAQWKAPDLAAYDAQFQQSLQASRAGIANQFQRALEDITAQEGIANKVVGTLPGQYADIWGRAESQTQQGLQGLQGALEQSGLGGMMTAEQMYAPLQGALAGGRAGFEASVPLTELGTQELFTRQKGALGQARLGAEAPLEEASREWIGRRAGIEADITARENEFRQREAEREAERQRFQAQQEAEQARFQAEQRAQNARLQAQIRSEREMTPYQRANLKLESRRLDMSEAEARAAKEDPAIVEAKNYVRQAGKGVDAQKGRALLQLGQGDKLRNTSAYKTLERKVSDRLRSDPGWFQRDPAAAHAELLRMVQGKPWDRTASVILADLELGKIAGPKREAGGGGGVNPITSGITRLRGMLGRAF